MNLITYLADSRGLVNSMQRIPTIALRFGWSTSKMGRALNRYADIAAEFGTVPSLAVTANLLERYPRVFTSLAGRGVELLIHGWVHTDYSRLGLDEQKEHLERGLAAFERLGISVDGFRCPYVRWNNESMLAAKAFGLRYSSNRTLAWDVIPEGLPSRAIEAYEKGLQLYGTARASTGVSLPSAIEGVVDLPASMPDDEAMVDRLRLPEQQRQETWSHVLDEVHRRGELFVVILHHERLELCASALEGLLARASRLRPHVWVAPMRELADWWKRRTTYRLQIEPLGEGSYRIVAPDDGAVTVLARGVEPSGAAQPWSETHTRLLGREAVVRSRAMPAIGVDRNASPALVEFLEQEGYVVERNDGETSCILRLHGWREFAEDDKRRIVDTIEQSAAPLVRLWRWPRGARCAVSLTGDVDSMTLLDFLRRPLEV